MEKIKTFIEGADGKNYLLDTCEVTIASYEGLKLTCPETLLCQMDDECKYIRMGSKQRTCKHDSWREAIAFHVDVVQKIAEGRIEEIEWDDPFPL